MTLEKICCPTCGKPLKKSTPRTEALKKAFDRISIKDLATQLRTSTSVIYNIKYGKNQASAIRAIEIEKITDKMGYKISRNILRPDVFGA